MIKIVIDIESTGRSSGNVFLVGLAAYDTEKKTVIENQVFYLPEKDISKRCPDTMGWWESDPNRAEFLHKTLKICEKHHRGEEIFSIRKKINDLYKTGKELVFYSDFSVFDHGQLNSMMEQYDLLPIYLKDNTSCPSECVDWTTWVKGVAHIHPNGSSDKAFERLRIERKKLSDNHDPLVDTLMMLENILAIEDFVKDALIFHN